MNINKILLLRVMLLQLCIFNASYLMKSELMDLNKLKDVYKSPYYENLKQKSSYLNKTNRWQWFGVLGCLVIAGGAFYLSNNFYHKTDLASFNKSLASLLVGGSGAVVGLALGMKAFYDVRDYKVEKMHLIIVKMLII
jgi:hypothetical protein